MEFKKRQKTELTDTENRLVVALGGSGVKVHVWRVGKMGEGSQNVRTSIYKISPEDVMYTIVTIVNDTVFYV